MRFSFVLSGLMACLMTVSIAMAQEQAPAPDPVGAVQTDLPETSSPRLTRTDLESWLDGFMPSALENGDIAGAVVVVVKDGEVLLQKGYGYADLETHSPVDPDNTLFRPGSISKLFTWTAVMQLVEAGKLDLDADVNGYLDFTIPPRDGKPVTLRQIMTHTTGMEEQMRNLITTDPANVFPLGEALKDWVPERIHVPGATPAYSNYATAMAGYIVERVSGEPFYDYIDKHILQPLGMTQSSFRQPLPANLLAKMSKGYASASDGKAKPYELLSLAPAGSLAITGADMSKFMLAHLGKGTYNGVHILGADTAEKMHRTAQASLGPLNRMFLGFYETTQRGHFAISHGGDTEWFHSDLHLFPDDGVGIYVSLNSAGVPGASGNVRAALVNRFVERYLPGPIPQGPGISEEVAKQQNAKIAGSYVVSRRPQSNIMSLVYLLSDAKVIVNDDGSISFSMAKSASGGLRKWKPIGPWLWQDQASGNRLAAEVDKQGNVVRIAMEPYASVMVFERDGGFRVSTLPLLAASLAALLLTVVAWPIAALVRRHYKLRYPLQGVDAKAQRIIRIACLAMLLGVGLGFGYLLWMAGDVERFAPAADIWINLIRLFNAVVLPLGALAALWNAWQVLRSGNRGRWAKLWSLLLLAASLFLLVFGLVYHLIGYGADY